MRYHVCSRIVQGRAGVLDPGSQWSNAFGNLRLLGNRYRNQGPQLSTSSHIVRNKSAALGPVSEAGQPQPIATRSFIQDLRQNPAYRPDIDGLRALAIIPVLIFHAFPTLLPGGFVGVDIFFVISGFLISSIIFKGLQRETFSFTGFYANRIKRIFPALLLVLIVSFVFGWFFLLPGEFAQLGKQILGGAGYVENFLLRREAGYFDTKSYLKPLMHLWSLGIEEQFYLTYPFLLWLAWRLRWNQFVILVTLVVISFSLNVWQIRGDAVSSFFLPQTRFRELWIGGALAYLDIFRHDVRRHLTGSGPGLIPRFLRHETTGPRAAIVPNMLSIVGVLLLGVALLRVHEHAFPGWWALLPVGGASLLVLAGPASWINRRILSSSFAVFVGLISYPLYLWHWPILSFGRILRGDELPAGTTIAAVMLSFPLAWATWRFVESPIRFGRKTWRKTAALLLTSVIVACIGYATHSRMDLRAGSELFPVILVGQTRSATRRPIAARQLAPTRWVTAAASVRAHRKYYSLAIPMQPLFTVDWPQPMRSVPRR
jgi:peptidoglycan/LPS O-acetylase OafA/YrhL